RARDRLAEATGADQRDVVLPLRTQDLPDLSQEPVDAVADAPLAELAETREIPPDLGGVDVRVVRDLLRGDPLLAHLLCLGQHLQVPTKAGRDSHRHTLCHTSSLYRCL